MFLSTSLPTESRIYFNRDLKLYIKRRSALPKDVFFLSLLNTSFEGCCIALLQNKTALILCYCLVLIFSFSFYLKSVNISSYRRKRSPDET